MSTCLSNVMWIGKRLSDQLNYDVTKDQVKVMIIISDISEKFFDDIKIPRSCCYIARFTIMLVLIDLYKTKEPLLIVSELSFVSVISQLNKIYT